MRILITLLAITLFTSCNQKQKNKEQTKIDVKTENIEKQSETPKTSKNVATGFGGIWVNKKYVDKLLSTKSPKKSQDVAPITMLILPNNTKQPATIILGFHEGTTGKVVKRSDGFELLADDNDDPVQTIHLENDRIKLKNDEFIKIKPSNDKNDSQVVEQLLFAGKYEMDGKQVEFTATGKVTGLDSFSYYSVLIDYYDAGMQVDQIRLGKGFKDSKLYGFEFKHEKLTIYELKCVKVEGDYCAVVKNGKKLYQLIKK